MIRRESCGALSQSPSSCELLLLVLAAAAVDMDWINEGHRKPRGKTPKSLFIESRRMRTAGDETLNTQSTRRPRRSITAVPGTLAAWR